MHLAIRSNELGIVRELIAAEADTNKVDSYGRTPISEALQTLENTIDYLEDLINATNIVVALIDNGTHIDLLNTTQVDLNTIPEVRNAIQQAIDRRVAAIHRKDGENLGDFIGPKGTQLMTTSGNNLRPIFQNVWNNVYRYPSNNETPNKEILIVPPILLRKSHTEENAVARMPSQNNFKEMMTPRNQKKDSATASRPRVNSEEDKKPAAKKRKI